VSDRKAIEFFVEFNPIDSPEKGKCIRR